METVRRFALYILGKVAVLFWIFTFPLEFVYLGLEPIDDWEEHGTKIRPEILNFLPLPYIYALGGVLLTTLVMIIWVSFETSFPAWFLGISYFLGVVIFWYQLREAPKDILSIATGRRVFRAVYLYLGFLWGVVAVSIIGTIKMVLT